MKAPSRRSTSTPSGGGGQRQERRSEASTPEFYEPLSAEQRASPVLSATQLAAKFPWAAQFANAKLDDPLFGDSDKGRGKKENLHELLDEISRITDNDSTNPGPSDEGHTGSSFFGGGTRTKGAVTKMEVTGGTFDMTETWGGAGVFSDSMQQFAAMGAGTLEPSATMGPPADRSMKFGGSAATLDPEDILAAALH